jgi:hypothetical protein
MDVGKSATDEASPQADNNDDNHAMDIDAEPLNMARLTITAATGDPSPLTPMSTPPQHELPKFWVEMPPKPANWKEYKRLTLPRSPPSSDQGSYRDPADDGAELLYLAGEHNFGNDGIWIYSEMDDESFRKVSQCDVLFFGGKKS